VTSARPPGLLVIEAGELASTCLGRADERPTILVRAGGRRGDVRGDRWAGRRRWPTVDRTYGNGARRGSRFVAWTPGSGDAAVLLDPVSVADDDARLLELFRELLSSV